jgi:UDP-N-acetyl-D-galactosamine dehydrogenase
MTSYRYEGRVVAQCIGVMGLGYVGLPLAVAFGRHVRTVGYDPASEKVSAYRMGTDPTGEVGSDELAAATMLSCVSEPSHLSACDLVIVAVPTPVDDARLPDFSPLVAACRDLAPHMRPGVTVVFESTVYPGATEEICVSELERASGRKWKRDFWVGYSPERVNPGDREHTLSRIVKVVSGDTPETLDRVAKCYSMVVEAGVHRASSIRVAEAAKVIENTQRDVNIALMNELALVFHRLGIDTTEVLEAAGTKWNFLKFRPGLVGGHCIGVDPYYLTYQAQRHGHHPEVILSGRRINDSMGRYIAHQTVKEMVAAGRFAGGATVNVLGLTFKENCADLRNSKVADLCSELQSLGLIVHVHDPRANAGEAIREYGIALESWDALPEADALVLAVAHDEFRRISMERLFAKVAERGCVVDVKGILDRSKIAETGRRFWRL